MFTSTLLCFSLTHLIIESKLGHEFNLFVKQIKTNIFTSQVQDVNK